MANSAQNKLDKTNVKYRKVEEGPVKKTGLEQLEQMKSKKRDRNISISIIDESINKSVKEQKNKNSSKEGRKGKTDKELDANKLDVDKSKNKKENVNKSKEQVSIQDLSENINNNLTVFKSRNKTSEDKNISINSVSNDISSKIEQKKKADTKSKDNDNKRTNSKNNANKKSNDKKINDKKNNDKKSKIKDEDIKNKGIKKEDSNKDAYYGYLYEEKRHEITDISKSSKVRRQAKRRSNKRKRQLKIEAFKQRVREINFKRVAIFASAALGVIALSVAISLTMIKETIIYEGNNYTEEQIENMVIKNIFDHNSVYLFLKYRYSEQEKIPFVEYIDVDWENASTVKIKVYDKSIIACTNFMNEYIYFDKDGMVVESSNKKQENIQYISGLNFKEVKLNDKIKVSDDKIFDTILSVTQQIGKYDLKIKEINFDKDKNLTLYTDNITILMGKKETYDEQLAKLKNMLEEADKKELKGILHMENYVEGQNRIIFNKID